LTQKEPGEILALLFYFKVNKTNMKRSVRIEETHRIVDIKTPKDELRFTIELFTADEPTDSAPR
jgi:hypothetical protein